MLISPLILSTIVCNGWKWAERFKQTTVLPSSINKELCELVAEVAANILQPFKIEIVSYMVNFSGTNTLKPFFENTSSISDLTCTPGTESGMTNGYGGEYVIYSGINGIYGGLYGMYGGLYGTYPGLYSMYGLYGMYGGLYGASGLRGVNSVDGVYNMYPGGYSGLWF